MPTAYDRRLIEDWLPVNEISIEAIRERNAASALPPINWLHVWWARRPLVVSRAAVAAGLLPADADREMFTSAMGTYPEIVADQAALDKAKATGVSLKQPVYVNPQRPNGRENHRRAFTHNLTAAEREWFQDNRAGDSTDPVVLDVTAGGGSIPFEAGRLGLRSYANELNPVAGIICTPPAGGRRSMATLCAPSMMRSAPGFAAGLRNCWRGFIPRFPSRMAMAMPMPPMAMPMPPMAMPMPPMAMPMPPATPKIKIRESSAPKDMPKRIFGRGRLTVTNAVGKFPCRPTGGCRAKGTGYGCGRMRARACVILRW